jgi:g-D-glutamyl-meso-diaminopimelate peptidase
LELSPYAGNRSVPLSQFPAIWQQNKAVGLYLAADSYRLANPNPHPVPLNENMTLSIKTTVYTAPSFLNLSQLVLSPQALPTYEHIGNWYHVRTKNGNTWLYVPNASLSHPVTNNPTPSNPTTPGNPTSSQPVTSRN